jgi:hypothetical protein
MSKKKKFIIYFIPTVLAGVISDADVNCIRNNALTLVHWAMDYGTTIFLITVYPAVLTVLTFLNVFTVDLLKKNV